MDIIKEYCEDSEVVVIRNAYYGSSLKKFLDFLKEARMDGFSISEDQVTIVHYGGERYASTFGIEFSYPTAPDNYKRISRLEFYR